MSPGMDFTVPTILFDIEDEEKSINTHFDFLS